MTRSTEVTDSAWDIFTLLSSYNLDLDLSISYLMSKAKYVVVAESSNRDAIEQLKGLALLTELFELVEAHSLNNTWKFYLMPV